MSDWAEVLNMRTPASALPAIAARLAGEALDEFRETLAADADLTPDDQARLLATVMPIVHTKTRAAVTSAWQRVQRARAVH